MRCAMFTATEHGPRNTPNLDSQQVRTNLPTSYAVFLYSCMSQQTFLPWFIHTYIRPCPWAGSIRFLSRTTQTRAIPILCPWFSLVTPLCFEHTVTHPFTLCAFTKQLQEVTSNLVISVHLLVLNCVTSIGRMNLRRTP